MKFLSLSPQDRPEALASFCAGLPARYAEAITDAENAYTFAMGAEFYSFGPRTRAAKARFDAAISAAHVWRNAQTEDAA